MTARLALRLLAFAPAALLRADYPINDNLVVTGTIGATGKIDSAAAEFTFGTLSGADAVSLYFSDDSKPGGSNDTLRFTLKRTSASWLWAHGSSPVAAMQLTNAHQLVLFQSDGTTAGVTLTPASTQLALGSATLTASGSALSTSGAFNVGGNLNVTAGDAAITTSGSGIAIAASGGNKSVSLSSSGTGDLVFNTGGTERARIKGTTGYTGIGTGSPVSKLTLAGTGGYLTVSDGVSGPYAFVQGGATVAYFGALDARRAALGNSEAWETLVVDGGNVGIGTTAPGAKLDVLGNVLLSGGRSVIFTTGDNATTHRGGVQFLTNDNGVTNMWTPTNAAGTPVNSTVRFGGFSDFNSNTVNVAVSGALGIGTTAPSRQLHVFGSSALVYPLAETSSTTGYAMWSMKAPGREYRVGVGGSAESGFGVAAKYFIFDADASAMRMVVDASGNVGIGTTSPGTYKLAVNGHIRARELVLEDTGWADYVFADNYRLAPLAEVEAHIREKKHLPGIPSAAEVAENGISVAEMQTRLLAQIEQIILRQIAQEKELAAQERDIAALRAENAALRRHLETR